MLIHIQVSNFVTTFNQDGRAFIQAAAKELLESNKVVDITPKQSRTNRIADSKGPSSIRLTCPKTFNHYVLNLPASAISFLPAFTGLYEGQSSLFESNSTTKLPLVHVHCFSTKSDDNKEEERKICKEISEHLGYKIIPGNPENEGEAEIWDVRDVAPQKRMFCASFRLPKGVAFRKRET